MNTNYWVFGTENNEVGVEGLLGVYLDFGFGEAEAGVEDLFGTYSGLALGEPRDLLEVYLSLEEVEGGA